MEDLVFAIIVFIFGIMIGSFLNVLIYRIPKGENIAFPASHCQSCLTPLKGYHNIPIFSWLFLGGKCGFCGEKISIQYPIVELITGLIAIALFYKLGLNWQLPIVFIVFSLLFALVMIDFKYMAVPDNLNYLALAFALIQPNYLDAIINAFIAGGSIAILRIILTKILKKEAMGEGDIPVIATMGALLGFPLFFVALFLSALLAMLPSLLARDKMVPFVPFLAMGTFIVYIFDTQALELLQWVIYG
ncbi:MAG: prepilin peptidase [Epsilonproteobacteria bacterium]|nr:prepilin peptidase [Campylobacterota bacterium]MBD3839024.1 prepilin peptidase [Campylobacterota bacterium]